jgi:hypothetical protein
MTSCSTPRLLPRESVPVATLASPQAHRSLPVDNIVIYREAPVRVRDSAGAGGGCQCRGDRRLRIGAPKGTERFQTGPEALGRGTLPQDWNLMPICK